MELSRRTVCTQLRTPTTSSHFIIDNQISAFHSKYGYYRIIIPASATVKYLALHDPAPSLPDIRGEKLDFTTVPDGDWNIGYLTSQAGTHKHILGSTEKTNLASISPAWHPQKIDWVALTTPDYDAAASEIQSAGSMFFNVYRNHFGFDTVVVSYEWVPEAVYGVDHETQIYAHIDGHQIAPRFLAHITENSGSGDSDSERVIGFMIEKVNSARLASNLEDLPACQEVLARLHALNIAHGPLRKEHFLITADDEGQETAGKTTALLQSFAAAYQTYDQSVLDAEMKQLETLFEHTPEGYEQQHQNQGFTLSLELSNEIRAISIWDGGLHPHVIEQARSGIISITEKEHKGMLAELRMQELGKL